MIDSSSDDGAANPQLIEPGVKYFLNCTLQNCRHIKERYYNRAFNAGLFAALVIGLGILLYVKYKGKLTPAEKAAKDREQREYILGKLRLVNATRYAEKNRPMHGGDHGHGMGMITDLPMWKAPDEEYFTRKYF